MQYINRIRFVKKEQKTCLLICGGLVLEIRGEIRAGRVLACKFVLETKGILLVSNVLDSGLVFLQCTSALTWEFS
jgi:hypothetical protein